MRIFLLVVSICLPTMISAERIIVRSGEHADFSRLAFEFPNPVEWKMGRIPQGYQIRLDSAGVPLDISSVYRRISHDRIKSILVSDDSTRVTLELGCECHADAFEFRPGLLVIDIKDGLPTGQSGFEAAFYSDETAAAQPAEARTRKSSEAATAVDVPKPSRESGIPLLSQLPRSTTNPRVGMFAERDKPATDTAKDVQMSPERVAEMQSTMLHQIGRAAAQGLLDANLPQPVREELESRASSTTRDFAVPSVQPHVNIYVESSVDREFGKAVPTNNMTEGGAECLPDSLLDVVEWGDLNSIVGQIAKQRGRVSGEFDETDEHAVEALAKAYIYAGFGAEARGVLAAFDPVPKNADILRAMANIVDGEVLSQSTRLEGQAGCAANVALWSVLAAPELSKGMVVNRSAILGAFSSLPSHLRRYLGPSLSQKFLDIEDMETTWALRNAIARAPGDIGSELLLLDARLNQMRGMQEPAEQLLKEIVAQDSEVAPSALVELLELRLDQNVEIGKDLFTSAESFLFEQKNSETGAKLMRVIALARGQSGDLSTALEMLREIEVVAFFDTTETGSIWTKVLEAALREANDDVFLQFIYAAQDDLGWQKIGHDTRRQVAARLLDNGLPEIAEKLLAAPALPTVDDRLLLARVAILSNEPERAITIVEHVSGDEAAKLRAQAYELWGKHSASAREYGLASDHDNQQSLAWRAGDWGQLSDIGTQAGKAAALIMLQQDLTTDGPTPAFDEVIARDRLLLEASEETRQSIEVLLEEYPRLDLAGS